MSNSALETELIRQMLAAPSRVYMAGDATPLRELPDLGLSGLDVYAKLENFGPINAYKWRGAFNAAADEVARHPNITTLVAASAGNHAQGLALSARKLGVMAEIFMPKSTPMMKQNAVKFHGQDNVRINLVGDTYDEASAAAKEFQANTKGSAFIHPFDDIRTIAGQSTIGSEILSAFQGNDLDYIFVPIGGGGLAAGIGSYVNLVGARTKVIGVEGVGQASMKAAFEAGHPVELPKVDGFCDGTAVKLAGELTYELCRKSLHEIITVTDDEVSAAMELYWNKLRIVPEPSGAMTLAGVQKFRQNYPELFAQKDNNQSVKAVVVCSGANMDFSKLASISAQSAVGSNRRRYLRVAISEEQGGLLSFLDTYFRDVNVKDFQYGKNRPDVGHPVIGIEASQADMDQLVARLQQDNVEFADVSNAADVRMRNINYNASMLLDPVLMNVEFTESKGALRKFMAEVSEVANLCYFNYQYAGDNTGRAMMGFEFSSQENRDKFLMLAQNMDVVKCERAPQDEEERVFGHVPQQRTATTRLVYNFG